MAGASYGHRQINVDKYDFELFATKAPADRDLRNFGMIIPKYEAQMIHNRNPNESVAALMPKREQATYTSAANIKRLL